MANLKVLCPERWPKAEGNHKYICQISLCTVVTQTLCPLALKALTSIAIAVPVLSYTYNCAVDLSGTKRRFVKTYQNACLGGRKYR